MRYLARLVHHPHRRFHARDLVEDDAAAGEAERARHAVRRAVSGALARVAAAHPVLGEHLGTTVRAGTYSVYAPDPGGPVRWDG